MPDPIVNTQHLAKHYGPVAALDDCTLAIPSGEVFGLLGPNGSGKSTLLRLLMGFLRPTHGEATVLGYDCWRESVLVRRNVAYLPGDVRLFPRMRGSDVLKLFTSVRPNASYELALQLAKRLDVDLRRPVSKSSTGMRQKLALAGVLAVDAPLVILDEPTANLDPTIRREMLLLVREAADAGRTVVFSSHVLSEVEAVCDAVALIRKGKYVHRQEMKTLLHQHRIRLSLSGPLPELPADLREATKVQREGDLVTIYTPGSLSAWLAWLAEVPLAEIQIEPVGLGAIYEKFYGAGALDEEAATAERECLTP